MEYHLCMQNMPQSFSIKLNLPCHVSWLWFGLCFGFVVPSQAFLLLTFTGLWLWQCQICWWTSSKCTLKPYLDRIKCILDCGIGSYFPCASLWFCLHTFFSILLWENYRPNCLLFFSKLDTHLTVLVPSVLFPWSGSLRLEKRCSSVVPCFVSLNTSSITQSKIDALEKALNHLCALGSKTSTTHSTWESMLGRK